MARGIAASRACQTDRRTDGCLLGYDRQFDKLHQHLWLSDFAAAAKFNNNLLHLIPQQHALFFFFMIIINLFCSSCLLDPWTTYIREQNNEKQTPLAV